MKARRESLIWRDFREWAKAKAIPDSDETVEMSSAIDHWLVENLDTALLWADAKDIKRWSWSLGTLDDANRGLELIRPFCLFLHEKGYVRTNYMEALT